MESDWDRGMRERAEANRLTAEELSKLLGGVGIKLNARDFEVHLAKTPHGPKSVTIITDERDKWKVVRDWPQIEHTIYQPEEGDERPVIRVAKKRPIADLAKEIQRRLLPGYDAAWDAQVARATREINAHNTREATLRELNTRVGNRSEPSGYELQNGTLRTSYHNIYEVRVSSDGTKADIKTNLMPLDVARQVIDLIKRLNPRDA